MFPWYKKRGEPPHSFFITSPKIKHDTAHKSTLVSNVVSKLLYVTVLHIFYSCLDKARILNAHFSSVFTKESPLNTPSQDADPIRQYPPISKLNITTEGIQKLLENLNPNKAMGPERLHPRVLKETARAVAPILQIIFSKSLENSEVPDDWKQANISPFFKKGERYCPSNYRSVSLTCVCAAN